ncbi:abortive phage infection protein [Mesorhizobium sp. Root157]|uniref:CPBP family intramembrane glutamic endopeptidase n=1 Tax=Mesorhizobium sp. Root157 TaxID=1736477 RepID=UPI0006F241BB|nr:CPBP family intramembrane glutamic endopeptidase [Mesorhizobium sp. Root157]KRA00347.1 abortive phage infection protein [Mesorhizobium sp. Root157]
MLFNSQAFERYRRSPNDKTTLLRIILGVAIVMVAWASSTLIMVAAGAYIHATQSADAGEAVRPNVMESFMASPAGILTALLSFAGIWLGVWIAMRWVHRERITALFGNSRRISRDAFLKGFVAVVITSLLSEVLLYLLRPEIGRGSIPIGSWLLFLVPICLLTFVQTSSEELLFRGYLPRGLAKLFRSPVIWGLLPLVVFTSLHWSPTTNSSMNMAGLGAIGAFALVLMVLVYATGNLGAAFGAHLGNNLFGFLLISHQESYNAFALFTAAPLEGPGWGSSDALLITAIGIISSALTLLLLVHPRSFLRVAPDLAPAGEQGASSAPA